MKVKSGVTIIEVMVAIVIFTIIMVGGFVFFIYGRAYISHSNHRRMALELSKEKIETCKAFGYNNVQSGNETGISLGSVQFSRNTVVSETIASGTYKTVTVTTSWQERTGTYNIQLVTIIAKD